jgi:dTDP-4-dehydrorhamnose reductase
VTSSGQARILLLGRIGQLGWELERCLQPLGPLLALDVPEIDLVDGDSIRPLIRSTRPEVIINATAYTAVDQAEVEPQLASAMNATAPGILAEEALRVGAGLVHFSTDYVFDGEAWHPYVESDPPHPVNLYGTTKLEGERAIQAVGGAYLILRTSWLYSLRRRSFVTQVLHWARTQTTMRVVSDQVGSPTWCRSLAAATACVIAQAGRSPAEWLSRHAGVYHLAGQGSASRWEWAREIVRFDPAQEELVVQEILPARSDEFPTSARRPAFSALDCARFRSSFGFGLPDWREALRLAMEP